MRIIPYTHLVTTLLLLASFQLFGSNVPGDPPRNKLDVEAIKFRMQWMQCAVRPAYNTDVAAYLRSYLTYGYKDSERVLGRSKLFFPIFEHYLDLHDMPRELKYLPMVESSLVPYAVSYSGAAGLWQFVSGTGRHFGLIIDKYLDERKDPYKSTEAAVKYLKKLHKRFGSWELALAAYNCGPTRLSRIIRANGTKDFWELKPHLPRETQRYVSRYIAACYVAQYYQLHGLNPKAPAELAMQPMAAKVYSSVSLRGVAHATGVELNTLRKLNPSFKMDYTPARSSGIFLVLPKASWSDYLESKGPGSGRVAARP